MWGFRLTWEHFVKYLRIRPSLDDKDTGNEDDSKLKFN